MHLQEYFFVATTTPTTTTTSLLEVANRGNSIACLEIE